jgi:hypothetical protein
VSSMQRQLLQYLLHLYVLTRPVTLHQCDADTGEEREGDGHRAGPTDF